MAAPAVSLSSAPGLRSSRLNPNDGTGECNSKVKLKSFQMTQKLDLIKAPVDSNVRETSTELQGRAVLSNSYAALLVKTMREIPKDEVPQHWQFKQVSASRCRDTISNH